jgi:hypothetical protein
VEFEVANALVIGVVVAVIAFIGYGLWHLRRKR